MNVLIQQFFDSAGTETLIASLVVYLITAVGLWGMFTKAGEEGWKGLIPFYSGYVEWGVGWKSREFLTLLCGTAGLIVLSFLLPLLGAAGNVILALAAVVWLVYAAVLNARFAVCCAHRFGKSTAFGLVLLFLLAPVGLLILAFGRADYDASRDTGDDRKSSTASYTFDTLNYLFVTLVAVTTIIPFIYIIGASFATEYEIATRPMFFFPRDISLNAYRFIFSSNKILRGFANSIFITVCGTAINLFFTVTMAYALSKTRLRGRNFFLNMVIFSMFFSGGMIPGYIVIANILNLKNTFWAVLLPGAISAYNLMIVKNFFQGIPQELEESASIDGCTDLGVLWKIVLPLSLPVLATFGLFYAVGHWNAYFGAMIYMTGAKEKWPLQVLLRELIIMSNGTAGDMANMADDFVQPPEQSIKMAVIVVSTVPIMCVYPFLQKYFVKGVMVGALKG